MPSTLSAYSRHAADVGGLQPQVAQRLDAHDATPEEINGQLVELVELLQLSPVSALPEHVQLHARDLLERHQRPVERVDPVLAAPDQQHRLAQLVHLAPHHAELEVGARERLSHRLGGGQRLGLAGDREALVDEFGGDELLVEDHDAQELLHVLARRVDGELAEQLDALGGVGREQVDAQPAGAHQHQPARPLRVVQREPHRGAATERITHQRSTFDAEVVEQVQQRGGAVAVVLLVLGVLVGVAVARLVDGQHVEVPRQHRRCSWRSSTSSTHRAHRRAAARRSPDCRRPLRDSAGACRRGPARSGRSTRR